MANTENPRSTERLARAAAKLPHTTKKMFGGEGLLAENGAMFAGTWDDGKLLVKMPNETQRANMLAAGGKTWRQKTKTGTRDMPSWIVVPQDLPARTLATWIKRAHAAAMTRER